MVLKGGLAEGVTRRPGMWWRVTLRRPALHALRLRRNILAEEAVRMADVVRQLARSEVHDVVRTGSAVQPGEPTHPERNGVISARRIATHLPSHVEWNTTTKCDDAAGDFADPRSLFLEFGIERVGIVQSVEGPSREGGRDGGIGRLGEGVKSGSRECCLVVAEIVGGAGFGNGY